MKCISGMQIEIEVFYKLMLSLWVCITRHAQSTQDKFAYLSNISKKKKKVRDEVDFSPADKQKSFLQVDIIILISCLQIDIKGFFILILAFWMCVARHAQITQNNKLLFLCNIFRKK